MTPSQSRLTIVTPTYPLHFDVVTALIGSIDAHILDPENVVVRLVVEREHRPFVVDLQRSYTRIAIEVTDTESVLERFSIEASASEFLARAGRFSFQALKKIGGCLASDTEWILILDSESLFLKPFRIAQLLDDYRTRKYVFYSRVAERGADWAGSLSETMCRNACALVGGSPDRWFMEYYHWFYERRVWADLIENMRDSGALARWLGNELPVGLFENQLFYQFVANNPRYGYLPVDVVPLLQSHLPEKIAARVAPAMLGRLTVVGIVEHVLSLVSLAEVEALEPFFSAFALPFLRLEVNILHSGFVDAIGALPSVVALVSSHRLEITAKRVAVCVAGEFRSVYANIQSIRSFLTGVECDLYVHCWDDDLVPIVEDALQPFALRAEPRPDVAELQTSVTRREPMLKPDRDTGSLLMLYGIQRSLDMLAGNEDRYNFVVRMRPDTIYQQSLRELLVAISYDDVGGDDIVYLPHSFHSQGVNDQFAIGRTAVMQRYGRVFDYAVRTIDQTYFNPEHVFAGHLLEQRLRIKSLPMDYILLRKEPANFDWIGRLQRLQHDTWWSAPLPGPSRIRTATGLFRAKYQAMDFMAEAGGWENWFFLTEAGAFSRECQRFFSKPLVAIHVEHDYKNPNVALIVEIAEAGQRIRRFVEIAETELRLAPEKPGGMIFVRPEADRGTMRLTRFEDDLDVPVADLCVSNYDGVRFPAEAYDQVGVERKIVAPAAEPETTGDDGLGDGVAGETVLLERLLLAPGTSGTVSRWRRMLARRDLRRARAHRRRGDAATARDLYARVLWRDPFRAREWVQYGHALKDSGDWRDAASAYAMALVLKPHDADAARHHADALSHLP